MNIKKSDTIVPIVGGIVIIAGILTTIFNGEVSRWWGVGLGCGGLLMIIIGLVYGSKRNVSMADIKSVKNAIDKYSRGRVDIVSDIHHPVIKQRVTQIVEGENVLEELNKYLGALKNA